MIKPFFRLIYIAWLIRPYLSLKHLLFLKQCHYKSAEAVRLSLEKLGPIFVKLGQALSMRRDLIPADMADELEKLQDQVPPFDASIIKQQYEHLFLSFDVIPLASASIAQVHAVVLKNGQKAVAKILRPGIKKKIQQDIAFMYFLAKIFKKQTRQFKLTEIVAELELSLLGELDLQKEAASASQLKRFFKHSRLLYVPIIYWQYSSAQMLVMERIQGISIRDKQQLINHGINLKTLAERIIEIFFTQVFRDGFFHADMHAGNIFVSYDHPEDPQYIAVDFGIMGGLNDADQRYIAENFLAFFKRHYRQVAVLHIASGWAPAHTRVDQLEAAIRTVCEPMFEKSLSDISFGQLLLQLFTMAKQFDIQIQPQLILLQKTLLSIEGLSRYLYPTLNLWEIGKPFLEKWIKTQVGPRAFLRKIKAYAPIWLEKLPELPDLIYRALENTQKK